MAALAAVLAALVGSLGGVEPPSVPDEFANLFMGQTFAQWRLTNPTPAFWEQLEAYHLLSTPTFMGKYPPGQGLAIGFGILLGHASMGIWLSSALMVGAVTWMLQVWLPRRWALLGGLLVLLQLGVSSYWAQSYWGGALAASGGALLYGSVGRAWTVPRWRYGVGSGIGLLILANTRPLEGLLVSLPPLFALLLLNRARRRPLRLWATLAVVLSAGFAGMGAYNKAVTGSVLRMPYQEYQAQYAVAPNLLTGRPTDPAPEYRHEEFRQLWVGWDLAQYRKMRQPGPFLWSRLVILGRLAFVLVGLAGAGLFFLGPHLRDPWIRFALVGAGLCLGGTLLSKAGHPHYFAPALGPVVFLAVTGWRRVAARGARWGNRLMFAAAVGTIWAPFGFLLASGDSNPIEEARRDVERCLRGGPLRSLVLVDHRGPYDGVGDWIRNSPAPFESQIVWARSFGTPRDAQIIGANTNRAVWLAVTNSAAPDGPTVSVELVGLPTGQTQVDVPEAESCIERSLP